MQIQPLPGAPEPLYRSHEWSLFTRHYDSRHTPSTRVPKNTPRTSVDRTMHDHDACQPRAIWWHTPSWLMATVLQSTVQARFTHAAVCVVLHSTPVHLAAHRHDAPTAKAGQPPLRDRPERTRANLKNRSTTVHAPRSQLHGCAGPGMLARDARAGSGPR